MGVFALALGAFACRTCRLSRKLSDAIAEDEALQETAVYDDEYEQRWAIARAARLEDDVVIEVDRLITRSFERGKVAGRAILKHELRTLLGVAEAS